MKKLISSLIIAFIATSLFAQNQSSEHLSFKGVPIDGTLSDYISKMKQNGFTLIKTEDGIAMLSGDFAAYKNCIVGVATLKQKDLVSKITVVFPVSDTWSTLWGNYSNLKEMLTKKYQEPTKCVEKFDTYSEPNDDGDRMHAVKMDNCKYYTTYETEKGTIQLSIEHDEVLSCFVMLAYYDKINSDLIRAKAIDDL